MVCKSISLIVSTLVLSTSVHAAVFTFDDLPLSNPVITMGTGTGSSVMLTEYNGFQFTSDNSLERVDAINFNMFATASGPAYSGPYALTNNVLGNILITDIDGDAFSFESLFIKNWALGPTPETHNIRGFLGGTEVASVSFEIMDAWQQVVGNFSNIDTLMIDVTKASGETDLFMMDDLVLGPVVPVPAAVWLFGSGLIGLIGVVRRKRNV